MNSSQSPEDAIKRRVAIAAADEVVSGMTVGLGSGSTLAYFIEELGRRVRDGLRIVGVPTSFQARFLARQYGVPLQEAMDTEHVDLAVDGADEIDPNGHLIKGAGGALVQEKVVASMAQRFVVIADESKRVSRLGEKFPVPVEVVMPAVRSVMRRLESLGAQVKLRELKGKVGPAISDNGHFLIDARFEHIADAAALDREINMISGVVGHGLFVNITDQVLIGRLSGEIERIELHRAR